MNRKKNLELQHVYFHVNSMKFFSTAFLAATVHVNLWFSKKLIKSISAIVCTSTLRIHSSLCFVSCCAAWQMFRSLKCHWIECPFKNNQNVNTFLIMILFSLSFNSTSEFYFFKFQQKGKMCSTGCLCKNRFTLSRV